MTLCPFQAAADSGAGRHHARGEGALGISRGGVRGWRWNLTWATFWEVLWAKSRHEIKSYCHEISLISLGLVRSWTWLAKQNYCCETFWKLFGSLNEKISGHSQPLNRHNQCLPPFTRTAWTRRWSANRKLPQSPWQKQPPVRGRMELRNAGGELKTYGSFPSLEGQFTVYPIGANNENRFPISGLVLSHHVIIWACQVEEQKKKRMEEEKAQETANL